MRAILWLSAVRLFMYHGERFNAYSHLAGFLLAVAALVLMLVKAVESADGYRIAGALTFRPSESRRQRYRQSG